MLIKAIRTRAFLPPKDDLFSIIKEAFLNLKLKEESIIVVTSKVVSIWQGGCIPKKEINNKDDLIAKEADFYLERKYVPGERVMLTLKNNILSPTAGIDESNGNEYFILWPKNPFKAAKDISTFIKKEYNLKHFGVIITDSRCVPLRRGTLGFALSYTGFYPLKNYRGKKDIFGKEYKVSQLNLVDSLASASVLVMGEGNEQTPIAIIEDIDFIDFKKTNNLNDDPLYVDKEEDFYSPLLKGVKWHKGSGGA